MALQLFYNGGDAANSMWNQYLYSSDTDVLLQIYPWLKGVAEFYRQYPKCYLGEDGRYHFSHLGWAESVTSATDVIDDLIIMKGIFPTVIRASQILELDKDLRQSWQDFYDKLPDYPTSEEDGAISKKHHMDGFDTYAIGRQPMVGNSDGNTNDCRMRMLFAFDLVNLETKETKPDEWQMANYSFESLPVTQMMLRGDAPSNQEGDMFGIVLW